MVKRVADVTPRTIDELSRGVRQTRELVEMYTIDFAVLMRHAVPDAPAGVVSQMNNGSGLAFTKRMRLAGELCLGHLGPAGIPALAAHPSDTVRGWVCYMTGLLEDVSLAERLDAIGALADDPHFGVREWAWLGVRGAIVDEPEQAVRLLEPWTREASEYLRRYATEATRPRGVWAKHIGLFRDEPERAMPLLEPLRADTSKYVQDSVANWLNDASKTRPGWVVGLCDRWLGESPCRATERICRRAMRSL